MLYFSTLLLSVFITVSLIPVMTRFAGSLQMVDFPAPRKVHTMPIPRIGGVAMAFGVFLPIAMWARTENFVSTYLAGAGTLVVFGLLDDLKGLGYKAKLAGQVIAALIAVYYGGVRINSLGTLLPEVMQLPEWLVVSLTIVAIVGVTNAINLADGLDGLAAGISLLVFTCIGYLAYLEGSKVVVLLSLALAGALFGFLRFNTHPASLFMGDTGSQLLGYSAVVLAVKITQGTTPFSPLLPLIILGFPILDTLTVMVERIRKGRPLFAADKNHYHHRLIRAGFYHTEAVFTIYVIQAIMIVVAILFKYYSDWALMTFYVLFSVLIVSVFVIADRTGFQLKRYRLIDHVVKDRLRRVRDNNWIVRISFGLSKLIIPLSLVLFCFFPADVPGYVSIIAGFFVTIILVALMFKKNHMGFCLRFVLYLIIPVVLFLIEEERMAWVSARMFTLYHLSFGIIALITFLTVKYSRRRNGFRMTTMDSLIIIIAVVLPNLPDQSILSHHLGVLAAEIIVLLFSFEVLITELRGRLNALAALTLTALILIGIRGAWDF